MSIAICAASFVLAAGVSLWAAVVDARERTIPNAACAAVAVAGLVFGLARARTGLLPAFPPLARCLVVALSELAAGTLLELGYRRLSGRVGMGLGDVKFLSAWGCLIGAWNLVGFALACLAGALFSLVRGERTFALGPWLAGSFCLVGVTLALTGLVAC